MEVISLPLKLLLSIVLGGLIGLERESAVTDEGKKDRGDTWGLRTYSLISLLGAVAGLLNLFGNTTLSLVITITFFILLFLYYAVGGWMIKSFGVTSELGAMFSFLIGYFVTSEIFPIQLVIAIAVVIDLILSLKGKSKSLVLGIKRTEVDAFIGFAIIALVILPFLPNQAFHLTDVQSIRDIMSAYGANIDFFSRLEIINPFKLWFIVALITGIDVFGYVLTKIIGSKKGVIVASAVGGFISSTSTTQSLAQQSKHKENTNELVTAAIMSNMTSFVQIFILVAPLNTKWLVEITPILLIIIFTAILTSVFYSRKRSSDQQQEEKMQLQDENDDPHQNKRVFSLGPALKFAILLILIRIFTKTALVLFGESGFLLTSIIASFSGLDAIIINLSELAGGTLTAQSALFTLLCVNATNLLSKVAFSFMQGKREFAIKFTISMVFVIALSFVGYYFLI